MRHHVKCVICEKEDYIFVGNGAERKAGWFYGGKPKGNDGRPHEYWECPKCASS